jgi:hypothetical protein
MLSQLFAALPDAPNDASLPSFSTVVIGSGPHRLGKDSNGAPALLVALKPGGPALPPVELENLTVQHGMRCRLLRAEQEPEAATVTLVRCREPDRVLRDYFLSVVEAVLPLIGDAPSDSRVREVIRGLIELFRTLELPATKSIQGLWGELFLLAQASDVVTMLGAWHTAPEERYDFTRAEHRMEVKSAIGERAHHFGLLQLHPPAGTIATVASLCVERAGGGVSLAELLARIRERVATHVDLAVGLDRVAASSLGHSWKHALTERFDWERAKESLAFFEVGAIPTIHLSHVPATVSEVYFRSSLVGVPALTEAAMRERGGLCHAVLPLRSAGRR